MLSINNREIYIIYTNSVSDNELLSYSNGYIYHSLDNIKVVFYSYSGFILIKTKIRGGEWKAWRKVAYV